METRYQKPTELYAIVEKCVICGQRHSHSATEGYRSAHCIGLGSKVYKLLIGRDNPENIRLAEKYGIQLDSDDEDDIRLKKGSGDN